MPFRWSNIWDIAQCLFLHFMKNRSRKQYWLSGINVFMILLWKILYICLTCLTILAMIWNFWAHILQTEFVTILLFIQLFIYFWSSLGCTLMWNTLIPQQIATGIARGDLDPFTQMPFQVASLSTFSLFSSPLSPLLQVSRLQMLLLLDHGFSQLILVVSSNSYLFLQHLKCSDSVYMKRILK